MYSNIAFDKFAVLKFDLAKLLIHPDPPKFIMPVRFAPVKLPSVTVLLHIITLVRFAPLKVALFAVIRLRFAFERLANLKSAFEYVPLSFAFDRLAE